MGRRRLLLRALVGVALVAPLLAGAGLAAARASGITPHEFLVACVLPLSLCAAFLASAFVIGQVLPDSWSGCREESVTLLAAFGWLLVQWLLFDLVSGRAL